MRPPAPPHRHPLRHVGVLVATIAVLGGCGRNPDPAYATTVAAKGDVRDVVPAVGSVKALSQIEVRADVGGRVVAVLVDANARVRQGDVLARVKPDRLALDLEVAQAERVSAEAAVTEARARADQTRRNLANRRSLSEKGFISPAALNEAESSARAAEAMVARARADASRAAVRVRAADGALEEPWQEGVGAVWVAYRCASRPSRT